MIKMVSLVLLSIAAPSVWACGVSSPNYANLAISTTEEKIFSYGVKAIDEKLPSAVVSNCRETAAKRRFVMITFGPEMIGQNDSDRGTNFDKIFTNNTSCSIKNNPLKKILPNEAFKASFDSKWKFINECVEVQVTEMGQRPLLYPLDQTGCKITSVGSQSAIFNGGFCFFKPNAESQYSVSVGVKESCKKVSGYKDYGVNLQDLETGINYYTSSNYKDEINDLSSFGSSTIRLSVNPSSSLFKVSDDFGILRPSFPGDYPINDIHLGKIEITNQDDKSVSLKTPFVVNNFCKTVEKNGLKSSICDYATPYVGEVRLINSKGKVEASWYDGGIAPAQWQGILNGEGYTISKDLLRKNESYKLEVVFSDPYFEFNSFKKRVKSKLLFPNTRLPELYVGGGITEIPEITELDSIDSMIDVGIVGDVNFPAGINGLSSERKKLNAYFSTTLFPPMYSKACHPESGACTNVGLEFVKFTATLKVDGEYNLSTLEVERISKILGSYKKKNIEQPEYNCN